MAQPYRTPLPDRRVTGHAARLSLGGRGEVALAGAWELAAPDPRFGGLSALAVDGDALLALTDSGVVIRFIPPRRASAPIRFVLHDLPAGPGSAWRKAGRDSEALLRDPAGRGWWVAFEGHHSVWLYDRAFGRTRAARRLRVRWPDNKGGEALVSGAAGAIYALPEMGGPIVAVAGPRATIAVPPAISDAARLPDGRLALLVRRFGARGFASEVVIAAMRGRAANVIRLPLGALDNPEGLAAAPLANGGTRLWIVTDNDFRSWTPTLLIALDMPPGA